MRVMCARSLASRRLAASIAKLRSRWMGPVYEVNKAPLTSSRNKAPPASSSSTLIGSESASHNHHLQSHSTRPITTLLLWAPLWLASLVSKKLAICKFWTYSQRSRHQHPLHTACLCLCLCARVCVCVCTHTCLGVCSLLLAQTVVVVCFWTFLHLLLAVAKKGQMVAASGERNEPHSIYVAPSLSFCFVFPSLRLYNTPGKKFLRCSSLSRNDDMTICFLL